MCVCVCVCIGSCHRLFLLVELLIWQWETLSQKISSYWDRPALVIPKTNCLDGCQRQVSMWQRGPSIQNSRIEHDLLLIFQKTTLFTTHSVKIVVRQKCFITHPYPPHPPPSLPGGTAWTWWETWIWATSNRSCGSSYSTPTLWVAFHQSSEIWLGFRTSIFGRTVCRVRFLWRWAACTICASCSSTTTSCQVHTTARQKPVVIPKSTKVDFDVFSFFFFWL